MTRKTTSSLVWKTLGKGMLGAFLLFSFQACDKDEPEPDPDKDKDKNVEAEEEAVETMEKAVSKRSAGYVKQILKAAEMAKDLDDKMRLPYKNSGMRIPGCGDSFDTTLTEKSWPGSPITYDYRLSWNWAVKCTNADSSLTFNYDASGMYDAPHISSDDSSSGGFTLRGVLDSSASVLTYSGDYERHGKQVVEINQKRTFTSDIVIGASKIEVDESKPEILGGEATISIDGSTPQGSFHYGGDLIFKGNQEAVLKLDNGNSYTITW